MDNLKDVLAIFKEFFTFSRDIRSFAKFAALIFIGLIFLTLILLWQGAINQQLAGYTLLGLFIVVVLLIVLVFKDFSPRGGRIFVLVHEAADRTLGIENAEVRLALPEPQIRSSDDRGSVIFNFSSDYKNQTFSINASKEGYQLPKPRNVTMVNGERVEIGLKKDPHRLRQIAQQNNKLRILKILAKYDPTGRNLKELRIEVGLTEDEFNEAWAELRGQGLVRELFGKGYIWEEGKRFLTEQRS